MTRILVALVACVLLAAPRPAGAQVPWNRADALLAIRNWISAVQAHEPGTIDRHLKYVAGLPPRTLDLICRSLEPVLKLDFDEVKDRNGIRRRAALLHTDIALLLPELAADFTQDDLSVAAIANPYTGKIPKRREADAVVYSADGEYVGVVTDSAHWWMAAYLLRGIKPHAADDEFVALWGRAIAALFESRYRFGSALYHVDRALQLVPGDPLLLFYGGTVYEANASPRVLSVPATRPGMARELNFPSAEASWRHAETYFSESVKAGGPPEAELRLARVKGQLGKHEESAVILRRLVPQLTDPRLQYLGHLFLASAEGALGHVDASRDGFERAARMHPTAQAPLVGLSEMYRRNSRIADALAALSRVAALPADPDERDDPWVAYFHSFADDAEEQLTAVRAWVSRKEPR